MPDKQEKPVNVNDLSNDHVFIGLAAWVSNMRESTKGTVASRHLADVTRRHFAASDVLDNMLESAGIERDKFK